MYRVYPGQQDVQVLEELEESLVSLETGLLEKTEFLDHQEHLELKESVELTVETAAQVGNHLIVIALLTLTLIL